MGDGQPSRNFMILVSQEPEHASGVKAGSAGSPAFNGDIKMRKILLTTAALMGISGAALAETVVAVETAPAVSDQATDTAVGGVAGAAVGALIAGPVGAVVGAAAGGAAGATADPQPEIRTYILDNPVDEVVLTGDLAVGAGVPDEVVLYEIPDQEQRYVLVNGQYVLVDPDTRQIIHIYE